MTGSDILWATVVTVSRIAWPWLKADYPSQHAHAEIDKKKRGVVTWDDMLSVKGPSTFQVILAKPIIKRWLHNLECNMLIMHCFCSNYAWKATLKTGQFGSLDIMWQKLGSYSEEDLSCIGCRVICRFSFNIIRYSTNLYICLVLNKYFQVKW